MQLVLCWRVSLHGSFVYRSRGSLFVCTWSQRGNSFTPAAISEGIQALEISPIRRVDRGERERSQGFVSRRLVCWRNGLCITLNYISETGKRNMNLFYALHSSANLLQQVPVEFFETVPHRANVRKRPFSLHFLCDFTVRIEAATKGD